MKRCGPVTVAVIDHRVTSRFFSERNGRKSWHGFHVGPYCLRLWWRSRLPGKKP